MTSPGLPGVVDDDLVLSSVVNSPSSQKIGESRMNSGAGNDFSPNKTDILCNNSGNIKKVDGIDDTNDDVIKVGNMEDAKKTTLASDGNNGRTKLPSSEPTDVLKTEPQGTYSGSEINVDKENEVKGEKDSTVEEEQFHSHEDIKRVEEDEDEDDEEDEDEDNEDEDLDDEEIEPPKLKYSRLTQLPSNFFNRDPVSTCAIFENVFIFATHSGWLHITKPDFAFIRTFRAHRASVLSITTDGQYFATASMDGTVVVGSILDEQDLVAYDFKRPIHAVVFDNNYKVSKSFITGGMSGKIIRSSKNWLGQRVDTVLDEGNGPVVGIYKIQDLILWMNDDGITVFHTLTKSKISVIARPSNSPRGDMYWPRVHFPETDRIVIAWADRIWLLRVTVTSLKRDLKSPTSSQKSRIMIPSSATVSFRGANESKAIDIEHELKLEGSLIAGISTFRDDLCLVLTYEPPQIPEQGGRAKYYNPDLKLINTTNGEVQFEEELGLRNIDHLALNDYIMGTHIEKLNRYFIVSARDAVIAMEYTLDDRLNWYLDRERYLEAWRISEHLVSKTKRLNIGVSYLDSLVSLDKWAETAEFLKILLNIPRPDDTSFLSVHSANTTNPLDSPDTFKKVILEQWENWCSIFLSTGHVAEITRVLPLDPEVGLSKNVYNSILEFWLSSQDSNMFCRLFNQWSVELYDVSDIQRQVEAKLRESPQNDILRKSLIESFNRNNQAVKSVKHLMILKDPSIVQFLSQNHLISHFKDDLPEIIKLAAGGKQNADTVPIKELRGMLLESVKVLVDERHEIVPLKFLDLMHRANLDYVNFFYIEKLLEIDEYATRNFGDNIIYLYAQFDRPKLLSYLMKHSNYNIDEAIKLCEENDFIEELVYLLGKIGQSRRALMLIINKLDDPEKAIRFAKHQNEREAWDLLIEYSMNKPLFIKALIELSDDQLISFYDPISIIERIPEDIVVEGLKNSVTKISFNNELNLVLNQLILKIVYKESEDLLKTYRNSQLKGFEIEEGKYDLIFNSFETVVVLLKENTIKLMTLSAYEEEKDVHSSYRVARTFSMPDKIRHLNVLQQEQ